MGLTPIPEYDPKDVYTAAAHFHIGVMFGLSILIVADQVTFEILPGRFAGTWKFNTARKTKPLLFFGIVVSQALFTYCVVALDAAASNRTFALGTLRVYC